MYLFEIILLKKYCIIAFIALLHYCNRIFGGQLLHIAIFNSFFGTIAIAIVLSAIANALKTKLSSSDISWEFFQTNLFI